MKKQVNKLLSILTVVSTISVLSIGLVSLENKYKHENITLQAELSSTKSILTIAHNEISVLQNQITDLVDEKESVESEFQAYRERFEEFEVLVAEATAYAGDPITATGTVPKVGRTIAVDPKVIPLGSQVYVEGHGWRIAEDVGGKVKGNIIDIFMGSRKEALSWGRRNVKILIKSVDSVD